MTCCQIFPLNKAYFFSLRWVSLNVELFSFCMLPCWLALPVYRDLTGTMRIKVCLAAKFCALSFMACEKCLLSQLYYYLALRSPLCTQTHYTHTCPGNISCRHVAVWKRVKRRGPAPTVPSCLYELVTHSATNASRSQSQAPQHLCTSEHISVSLRVLELSG